VGGQLAAKKKKRYIQQQNKENKRGGLKGGRKFNGEGEVRPTVPGGLETGGKL